jgi:hypothetical protein
VQGCLHGDLFAFRCSTVGVMVEIVVVDLIDNVNKRQSSKNDIVLPGLQQDKLWFL